MRRLDAYALLAAYGTQDDIDHEVRFAADDLCETYGGADCIPDWEATDRALDFIGADDERQCPAAVRAFRRLLADALEEGEVA